MAQAGESKATQLSFESQVQELRHYGRAWMASSCSMTSSRTRSSPAHRRLKSFETCRRESMAPNCRQRAVAS